MPDARERYNNRTFKPADNRVKSDPVQTGLTEHFIILIAYDFRSSELTRKQW